MPKCLASPFGVYRSTHSLHAEWFGAYDMIAGILHPELGGSVKYLDISGSNFYYDNQWFYNAGYIPWNEETPDQDWCPCIA